MRHVNETHNYIFISIECVGTYSSELHKIVYLHNRTFLPDNSELRRDVTNFPTKAEDLGSAPCKRMYENLKDIHKAYDASQTK